MEVKCERSARASPRGGVRRKRGAKPRPDEQKPDMRQPGSDERTTYREVLIHQGPVVVDPAGVRGKRANLPREICVVSRAGPRRRRTEGAVRPPDPGAEVSRRHSRPCCRRSHLGTPMPKGGATDQ